MTIANITNPFFRIITEAAKFASMYESFNPLTTVNKQHFVEWFSGDALDSIWTFSQIIGAGGTQAMSDTIDGGLTITAGTSGTTRFTEIDFNGINNYSQTSSVVIIVAKVSATTNGGGRWGLNLIATTANSHRVGMGVDSDLSTTDYMILTSDGTSLTSSAATFALDTNYHSHKAEMKSASCEYTIDGVLEVTKTTNLPTVALQPMVTTLGRNSTNKTTNVIYVEVYNT